MGNIIKGHELEQAVSSFLGIVNQAKVNFDECSLVEARINDATQDILHTVELDLDSVDGEQLLQTLHELRITRRDAKDDVEVSKEFWTWCSAYKSALNELSNVLGRMRKVYKKQDYRVYIYKTDYVRAQGEMLTQKEAEPEFVQLGLWDMQGRWFN